MRRPRLLDLFCGGGGAAMGYARAGFEVVGVDIKPQPEYPFEFHQADVFGVFGVFEALGVPIRLVGDGPNRAPRWLHPGYFQAIHASPPCQAYTSMRHMGKGAGDGAPDLVDPTREALERTGLPWVMENVAGSPLRNPLVLCGSSFGLGVRRHRLFESSELIFGTPCRHKDVPRPIAVYGDHPQSPGERGTYRVNRARTLAQGQEAMGIDWMPWKRLTQAIPPAYTEHIGRQLIRAVEAVA